MAVKRLSRSLSRGGDFVVTAELTGGPGYNFAPIEKFLTSYKEASGAGIPAGFDFVAITVPQNPGGVANIDPADVHARASAAGLLDELDFVPHISCKDHNTDALISSLVCFKGQGVESILILTGDKPVKAQGVFEIEAVGLLEMVRRMNQQSYIKARPGQWDNIHQFFAGAAVSPFKYTEASQMQQYYKMEKKITAGAEYLITQVGWDWRKSLELMQYCRQNNITTPIIGNVYMLSTMTPAPRLMHDGDLPGCFVSDNFLAKIISEDVERHIERAAQQIAMYKSIGAAGVDVGGVHNYDTFTKLLNLADQINDDWEKYKENLYFPAEKTFYLYDDNGKKVSLSRPKKTFKQKIFYFVHRVVLDSDYIGFRIFKRIMAFTGAQKGKGVIYKLFNAVEKAVKYLLFECEECGDCYLHENFSLCTIGGCEKGLDNAPCGDATVEGYCGNNLERICIGEPVYDAASARPDGRDVLQHIINKPRNPLLANTSSIINYLFAKDHTQKTPLIGIGESVHASIPKTGRIMKELHDLGTDAYTKPSGPLNYIKALIEDQADDSAAYIAVNVDAIGADGPAVAAGLMKEYVRLVRKWGKGIPVCVDSSDDDVLIAGLKEWFNTDKSVAKPLLNSIKVHTADKIMPLKSQYDFSFVGLLVGEQKPTGPSGSHSIDELFALAKEIFEKAVKHDFKPEEIFLDSTVFPLASDMPTEPGVDGQTYRVFETIRKIKTDHNMKGVHCSLSISNCCRDLPGRKIGICRAYAQKAVDCGLDAGIVNVSHKYGSAPAAPELLELVDAFAKMDGSLEKADNARMRMNDFCVKTRKPKL